jgi:uncharacterized protein (DUF885 family)
MCWGRGTALWMCFYAACLHGGNGGVVTGAAHPIFGLSDKLVDEIAGLDPLEATYMGVSGHDGRWGDYSPEGYEQRRALLERARRDISALPPPGDCWAELAVRVADDQVAIELEMIGDGDHLRDVAHAGNSLFPAMREVFDIMDTASADGWMDICGRLETVGEALAGYRESLREGVRRGLVAPKRQVRSLVEQMRSSARGEGRFARLPADLAASGVGADRSLAERVHRATAAVCASVEETADFLEADYLPEAAEHDAVGEERYQRDVRNYLGTLPDLEETYAWGWEHLRELRDRSIEVARQIDAHRDLDGVVDLLKTDPRLAASGPEEFCQVIQARLDAAVDRLNGYVFDIPEQIRRVEVRVAAPGTPPCAWYQAPSEDFSRTGSAWWSFTDRDHIPLYEEIATAYHEGFPGHHLQVGFAKTISDRLSRLHRLRYWKPGYGEGWALYAERLMDELGEFDQPHYVFGMVSSSLLRAARVVVDIGLHLGLPIPDDQPFHPGKKWTYERGVEMLEHYAFLDRDYAESEVTRYLGWPAQAITYKVGERAILALRDEMRAEHEDLDLREFHNRVLGSGPVGLDMLRDIVLDPTATRSELPT